MELDSFLYIGLIVLTVVAIVDLVVGVGNDAVNFLNSALGSKIAKFKTIMWVATVGIFFGAISSAGMMEIARMGIFNPEYFTIENVMVIFIAVMLTDIILLDAFNTLGFPTSTTVSIIFELLGASLIVASYKVLTSDLPMNYLFNNNDPASGVIGFLNWSKTKTIIGGIFISVFIAFSVGMMVMWLSRVLFSFNYKRKLKTVGIVWSSLAMLSLTYFLVFKGLKSTFDIKKLTAQELVDYKKSIDPTFTGTLPNTDVISFQNVSGEEMEFNLIGGTLETGDAIYEVFFGSRTFQNIVTTIQDNFFIILLGLFFLWLIVFYILEKRGVNPLRIVVFAGIFSLAMAFAGNDLVNFIGVPLAGWQSYDLYSSAKTIMGNSLDSSTYLMSGLKFPIQTPYYYLILSGIVMTLTLWFSKKIRTVSATEVNLASQDETVERFTSNAISRGIVRYSVKLNQLFETTIPLSWQNKINTQFIPVVQPESSDQPAFDLVRASVNMTIASMLIALGTSLKLPLSTTYVTFMVAMGTSLADRAWGRESASYRIAGVINVIAGWFITALVAFVTAALMALVLIKFELAGLIFVVALVVSIISYTNYKHKMSRLRKQHSEDAFSTIDLTTDKALNKTAIKLAGSLIQISDSYHMAIEGLLNEDRDLIIKATQGYRNLNTFYSDIKNNLFKAIKKSDLSEKQTAQLYILSNDLMQDILQSLGLIISAADNHLKNAHKPVTELQEQNIRKIEIDVVTYLNSIANTLEANNYVELNEFKSIKRNIFDNIEASLSKQVEGISHRAYGFKNSDLVLAILLETKDLVAIGVRFSKLLNRLSQGQSPLGNRFN